MLNDRKKRILQAIVEEYVDTAEPVSSGVICQKQGIEYSSATIRNEMAELEKDGYLDKVHTSSGRVPSAKGYRLYVNELLKEQNLSLEETKYIKEKLETKVNEIEELTRITTNTLSEITHYTTVAIGPKNVNQLIEEIKFVLLGTRMLMCVIVTDSGLIKEAIIKFDEDINDDQVKNLNYIFNAKLKGKPFEKIDKPLEEYIFSELNYSMEIIKMIIEQINKVIEAEEKLYYEGANKVFEQPEFQNVQMAKNFINILDKKDLVVDLLNSEFNEDINVYIGDDSDEDELKDFSVITFKQKINDKEMGTIGIIGPKRMDYSKVISVMKYIKGLMGNGGK
ncbi:MAG: heat-inducible transcription repressor HrcA [Clostridia bacterium]|nr:heat-inducible transcription repressor HrcA [Clostridia bacterium]